MTLPPRPLLAALTALALAAGARADDAGLELVPRLVLHGRFTDRENAPLQDVLYARALRTLQVKDYLRPVDSQQWGSAYAAAGVDGRLGDAVRFGLLLDTGELRAQSFPATAPVCLTPSSPTGLDVVGSGRCVVVVNRRRTGVLDPVVPLPETRLSPGVVTANGRPVGDEASRTGFLREAWVSASFGRAGFATVRAGRRRFTVADGFVFDDWATGVEADLDLGAIGPSFDVGLAAIQPGRDLPWLDPFSPLLVLRADWLPSLFEHAGVFAAVFRDRGGNVAELFRGANVESSALRLQALAEGSAAFAAEQQRLAGIVAGQATGDATLFWAGTSGDLVAGRGGRLGWTAAIAAGSLSLQLPAGGGGDIPSTVKASVLGQLVSLRYKRDVGHDVGVGGFFVFLSGDVPPAEKARLGEGDRYGGFLGVSPYVTATNIFFQGGVSESFAARQATAPGVNGRGVVAPGVNVTWDPSVHFGVDARAAWLLAPQAGPYGGQDYGPEVDLELTWSPLEWLTFAAEGDVLVPGDFFGGGSPVTKVVLGVDVVPRW
ncbi:hypothetical protein [Anaeromyxobacter paludicola]|uniref:Alginate export domain-containing protein n=1 Tax=Anaeromyxobacter paludicola TaxID=2918171 RepID=A0ABM7XDB2_9BACT|nr:hypothetical protein [Anaeromyxobacter paludicola]BDG09862.1 hypothetical protein AMPC_29750 [Anaeromyxobacter paludicola]